MIGGRKKAWVEKIESFSIGKVASTYSTWEGGR